MVRLSAGARAQVEALERHYAERERNLATLRMEEALTRASARIEAKIGPFFPYPRPYATMSALSWTWLKEGRYWIAFEAAIDDYTITAVFYDAANIPGRL